MVLLMGAFKKGSREYVAPSCAQKDDQYECPDCRKDVIFRKGSVRTPHFAHKKADEEVCPYYNRPGESQLHNDAKLLLQTTLNSRRAITILSHCCSRYCEYSLLSWAIPPFTDTSVEYRFQYKNGYRVADVVCLEGDKIACVFEIRHTHKTKEGDRPEPWFEFDATSLQNIINDATNHNEQIVLGCTRQRFCENCAEVHCSRCKTPCPRWVMNTNLNNTLCKLCDIDEFEYSQRIYLNVPFARKDEVKAYGGWWDPVKRRWFIRDDNTQKAEIVRRWGGYS